MYRGFFTINTIMLPLLPFFIVNYYKKNSNNKKNKK